jgi:zinc transport system substrate-binding protein
MRRVARAARTLGLLALLAACEERQPVASEMRTASEAPLDVHVVSYPLRYLTERIGGTQVRVTLPVPPGVDPADWLPDAETIGAYQQADLIVRNGAGYARWLGLASLPRRRMLDTSAGFRERWIERDDTATHAHGTTGSHSHGGFESLTWLDPALAILQARAIAERLARERPAARDLFETNLVALERDLAALDERLATAADRLRDVPLLFSHPVYGYLIRRYGLNGRSLHFEPDQHPDAAAWRALRELLEQHPARWMLWEDEPLAQTREALQGQGVESRVYAPCGNVPPEGDLLSVMQAGAARLEEIARSNAS